MNFNKNKYNYSGLPKGLQKSAKTVAEVQELSHKIAEDFTNGNAINYFTDEELEYGAEDFVKFMESPEYDKIVKAFTKNLMDKKYRRMQERELLGLPTLAEGDGEHRGIGTRHWFQQFIPQMVYDKMIETLYERRIGKELVTMTIQAKNSKGVVIPVEGDRMSAVVINELTPIPVQMPTFSKITVRPYTIGVGFNITDEVVEEAEVNLIRMHMEKVAWALAEKQDTDIMSMLTARAGTTNSAKTFGKAQWTEDMQVLEDNLYDVDLAVVGNTISTYFRRAPDFDDGTNWHAAPELIDSLLRKGWIGTYFGVPLRRLATSRFDTNKYMMLNNTNMKNPVSALVTYKGIRFETERIANIRTQATYATLSYSPAVLNGDGILTTVCTS